MVCDVFLWFDEMQGYVVVFVDCLVFCIIGFVVLVGWWQCLYVVGVVFGVVWVGVDFVVCVQFEVGGFGYCDYLLLVDIVGVIVIGYIGFGVMFDYVQYVVWFEYVEEVLEYVLCLVGFVLVVYVVEGQYYIG